LSKFSVRIRFRLPPCERLGLNETQYTYRPEGGIPVRLKVADDESSIRLAKWLVVWSAGWDSQSAAESAIPRLMDSLRMALARLGLGADFGQRAKRSFYFDSGLKVLEKQVGRTVLNDEHGAMVFPSDLDPLFANPPSISAIKTVQQERWDQAFFFSLESNHELTEQERTAFDVYSAAHAIDESEDARFLLAFAALEILLEDSPRPERVVEHVEKLIDITKSVDLPPEEKDSLLGTMKWMKSYSIHRAGRDLVKNRLGDREYGGQPAERFFQSCYKLRNRLVHGNLPFPNRKEVSSLAGGLLQMVGHLIAGPTLNLPL